MLARAEMLVVFVPSEFIS